MDFVLRSSLASHMPIFGLAGFIPSLLIMSRQLEQPWQGVIILGFAVFTLSHLIGEMLLNLLRDEVHE